MSPRRDYERKRRRGATPEPFEGGSGGPEPTFVVQRHDASRLHYDFRLERDGVLVSWAVPKGVPVEPGTQHLAVHVEDHPLSYGSFEGTIPQGNYGAGTVEIWDSGTYELVEEKHDGGLTVRLHGGRLQGLWTLVPAKLGGDPKNWLLVKKKAKEEPAQPEERRRYAPMLATLTGEVPVDAGWLYEVKWDGFRALATMRNGELSLRSRNDNDLASRFPTVATALERELRSPDCVVDGEIAAVGPDGRATFSALQQAKPGTTYVFVAFDVLELEGILAKRAESKYEPGRRSRSWLKVKTHGRQEFVVCGYTKGQGRREGRFGALIPGISDAEGLRYVGNVGTGFDNAEIDRLLTLLRPLERPDPAFEEVPKLPKVRKGDVVWVEPELVCEVEFVEWTHEGRLRAPSYQGLREDKRPEDTHREREAVPSDAGTHGSTARHGPTSSSSTSTPRPTPALPRRCRWRCSSRRRSTSWGSPASRRRAARTGSTSSCRSSAARSTTTHATSPRSSPPRSHARIAASRRPSGRSRSAAAS